MRCRRDLVLRCGSLTDAGSRAARDALVREILGSVAPGHDAASSPWHSFAFFAPDGGCVANVDAAILPLLLDGDLRDAAAIRSVAVRPDWRRQGLFRTLMSEALRWCEARTSGPALLYTADPDLYRRFGFRELPQHAFAGVPPRPAPARAARDFPPDDKADTDRLRAALARRAPPSDQCALMIDAPLFEANLAADGDLRLAHIVVQDAADHDAAIVYEIDGDRLVIADIIAPSIPDMAAIVEALGGHPRRIKTLFAPDRLAWHGEPVAEDTGLMVKGVIPAAMQRPFMLPPTSEF